LPEELRIRSRLCEDVQITYIPIVSRRLDNIGVVKEFLPYKCQDKDGRPIFDISEEEFLKELTTEALYFPYLKKQVNVSTGG